jgi:hypothetical protein
MKQWQNLAAAARAAHAIVEMTEKEASRLLDDEPQNGFDQRDAENAQRAQLRKSLE